MLKSINLFKLVLPICIAFVCLCSCESKQKEIARQLSRGVNLTILHDNDRVLAEWLESGLNTFQNQINVEYPEKKNSISLKQE